AGQPPGRAPAPDPQSTMSWSTTGPPAPSTAPRQAPPPPQPPPRRPTSPSEYPTNVQNPRPQTGPPPENDTAVNARSAPPLQHVPPTEATRLDVRSGQGDLENFATRFVKRLAPRSTPSHKPAG